MQLTHAYPATQLADGTFEIRDLDIFETCVREHPITGRRDVFDTQWLRQAVEAARERESRGYFAPVHLGHHGDTDDEPTFAGFLHNLAVVSAADATDAAESASEADSATLRATITSIPAEVFARIRDRRIPYRSVEILDPAVPEISSLALLEATVPYFKFPITAVEVHTPTATAVEAAAASESAILAAQSPLMAMHFEDTNAGLRCTAPFAAATTPASEAAAEAVQAMAAQTSNIETARTAERLIADATTAIAAAHTALESAPHRNFSALVATFDHRLSALEQRFSVTATPPDSAVDGETNRDAEIERNMREMAAIGYVFADADVKRIAEQSADLAACFSGLRRVLPMAPVISNRREPAFQADLAVSSGDAVADAVLRDLGRVDEPARRSAHAAATEYAHLAETFSRIGCSFSKADFIRFRLAPICRESR